MGVHGAFLSCTPAVPNLHGCVAEHPVAKAHVVGGLAVEVATQTTEFAAPGGPHTDIDAQALIPDDEDSCGKDGKSQK